MSCANQSILSSQHEKVSEHLFVDAVMRCLRRGGMHETEVSRAELVKRLTKTVSCFGSRAGAGIMGALGPACQSLGFPTQFRHYPSGVGVCIPAIPYDDRHKTMT